MDKPENLNHRPKQTYQSLSYLYLYWPYFCFLYTPNLLFLTDTAIAISSPQNALYSNFHMAYLKCYKFRKTHPWSHHHPQLRALIAIVSACILVIYLLIIYIFSIHYNLSLVTKGTLLIFTVMLLRYKRCPAHISFQ